MFAVFALVAMAFAAPNPNPAVYAASPLAYSSLGYAAAPAVAYSHLGAVPAYGAYPYAAAPVVYG